jgi:hypothetical protein
MKPMGTLPKVGTTVTVTLMMGTLLAQTVLPGSVEGAVKDWTRNLNVPKKDAPKVIQEQNTCMSCSFATSPLNEFGRIANTS